jgi:hypothetical protein
VESQNNGHSDSKTKVEFIKLSEKEVLIRTQRNGTVVDRVAQVVPPEQKVKEPQHS